jgi:L-cysteine S-thiosulfotransferase
MRGVRLSVLALTAAAATTAGLTPEGRRSGYDFASPQTRAMQDDDTANPGMLWVGQGETLWGQKAGPADRSCADCHGDARTSMNGVAARYPAFDAALGRPIDLEQRINYWRSERQKLEHWPGRAPNYWR